MFSSEPEPLSELLSVSEFTGTILKSEAGASAMSSLELDSVSELVSSDSNEESSLLSVDDGGDCGELAFGRALRAVMAGWTTMGLFVGCVWSSCG